MILLKPSFLPLGFIGIWTRGWWIALAVLILGSLPFLAETMVYPSVILSAHNPLGWLYSVEDLPMIGIPVVLWLGRTRSRVPTPDAGPQVVQA